MWILKTFKCFEKLIGPRAAKFRFDTAEKELSEVDISDGRGFPERLSRLLVAAVFITVNRGDPLGPRHRDQAGPGQGGFLRGRAAPQLHVRPRSDRNIGQNSMFFLKNFW